LIQSTSLFDVRTQVRPEQFSTLTKDLQVIEATATVKYAVKPTETPRIYENNRYRQLPDLCARHSAFAAQSAEIGVFPIRAGDDRHRMEQHF